MCDAVSAGVALTGIVVDGIALSSDDPAFRGGFQSNVLALPRPPPCRSGRFVMDLLLSSPEKHGWAA
jgi:hypothetical protein